jgi:hypothetical protein
VPNTLKKSTRWEEGSRARRGLTLVSCIDFRVRLWRLSILIPSPSPGLLSALLDPSAPTAVTGPLVASRAVPVAARATALEPPAREALAAGVTRPEPPVTTSPASAVLAAEPGLPSRGQAVAPCRTSLGFASKHCQK